MKIEGNLTINHVTLGFDSKAWRISKRRLATSWHGRLGPFFLHRTRLPFCDAAARRIFDEMNHPDSPTRKLADLHRAGGPR
jgi:hypothetical protein